jgi:nucleotide-binding universal stress UspA family protein
MKTIVVPTDFSESAEHASLYAANLAKAVNATVLLLHVYQIPITMSDFPVWIVSVEELKRNADTALARAKEAVKKTVQGVLIETESRMGDVVEEIQEACAQREVATLVTGTKDHSGFERFLLGNTTLSIVKHSTFPVIAVPQEAGLHTPTKLALATDLLNVDEIPVQKITEVVSWLNAELHVVHVEMQGEKLTANNLPEGLKEATYHSLKEDDVTEGVQHFVKQNNIDLLLILPHKHTLYERLFLKGHTEGLIKAMPVPVMCLRN